MKKLLLLLVILLFPAAVLAAEGATVEYNDNGMTYEGYFVTPNQDSPLILLIHDWDGLTGYEVKRANMLAKLGYTVFAADLFGKGIRPTQTQDKRKLTGELYQNRSKMRSLINAALNAAKGKGANVSNAVAMGYCFGGTAVLELARSGRELKGFVSFHGGLQTPKGQDYANTKGSLLVLHGSADQAVTMDDFAALAKQLESASVEHEMITYSGAPHAFTVFGSNRYQKAADEKSWARFVQYLADTLNHNPQ
jgi:dienelactone hydrolase